jgi:hypothetical protein
LINKVPYRRTRSFIVDSTEKTPCEEKGGIFLGVLAAPTLPKGSVPLSQLTLFQWNHTCYGMGFPCLVSPKGGKSRCELGEKDLNCKFRLTLRNSKVRLRSINNNESTEKPPRGIGMGIYRDVGAAHITTYTGPSPAVELFQ